MSEAETVTGPTGEHRPVPRWAAPFVGVGGAIAGGLYVIFMPVIFAGMALYYLGVGVKRLVTSGSRQLAEQADDRASRTEPPREP